MGLVFPLAVNQPSRHEIDYGLMRAAHLRQSMTAPNCPCIEIKHVTVWLTLLFLMSVIGFSALKWTLVSMRECDWPNNHDRPCRKPQRSIACEYDKNVKKSQSARKNMR
jgi:hypothetical protein